MGKFAILATLFRKYFTEQRMFSPFFYVIHIAEVYSLFLSICKSTKYLKRARRRFPEMITN